MTERVEDRASAVAAVDLGSNSFHMVIARVLEHDLHLLDRHREPVCLAAGLDGERRLTEEAQERALACLERFGQRLRGIPPDHVRAVGTNTLRRARNAREFRRRAQRALGHPIEVISGQEEARLIYLGVAHHHPADGSRQLVIDIGGGSTEIILGRGFDVLHSHSLFMGCVGYSQTYFTGGALRKESFQKAEVAARLELRAIEGRFRPRTWDRCIGTSGTINTIDNLLRSSGSPRGGITLAGLKMLRRALVGAGTPSQAMLATLKPERARVLPGGLAILIALFKSLDIEELHASSRALREGVLYDLVGRMRHEDVRDRTIRRLVAQYHVDLDQAERVERTALDLLAQLTDDSSLEKDALLKLLGWAAKLHEVGLAVSHTGLHKHGAYLVAHSDMPGFSADDQLLLATLIRAHRRKLSQTLFDDVPAGDEERVRLLCIILRLAVLLNRSRISEILPEIQIAREGSMVRLTVPAGWLQHHPLTLADLEQERFQLDAVGYRLETREAGVTAPRGA